MGEKGVAPIIVIVVVILGLVGAAVLVGLNRTDNSQTEQISSPNPTIESASPSATIKATVKPSPVKNLSSTIKPTPTLQPSPNCEPSTIVPGSGNAPFTLMLHGGGSSPIGIKGYQWDFTNDGVWDTDVDINEQNHTFDTAGTYHPIYRVQDTKGNWSPVCNYKFPIEVKAPPSEINAYFSCVDPDEIVSSQHLDLHLSVEYYNPSKSDLWTTITDQNAQKTVYVGVAGQPGTHLFYSFTGHGGQHSIRTNEIITYVGDGRNYTIKLYKAPFSEGVPNLSDLAMEKTVSMVCP